MKMKRSVIGGVLLSLIFLGGMNSGCSMSSTLAETAVSAGITALEYLVEAVIESSSTTTTTSS